ncbi:MAG: response regulator [Oligoflexia bacterium]|nr:response regulator [Oligoflexia bacterium]MBF0366306.1 response regulator [Oligoflexia bacterium]
MTSPKIMIIDDDLDLIEAAKIALEANKFQVVYEISEKKAVAAVIREKPDIVLLDVMFPENPTAGFEICRELKKLPETTKIPVFILSAINDRFNMCFNKNFAGEGGPLPAKEFIEKPIDPAALISLIQSTLSGK